MNAFTKEDLKRFQAESLPDKEQRSLAKISEWFSYWNNEVYVAFSGGKDSSVLADLCGLWCSIIKATLYLVFVDTGLEYPEIKKHVKDFAEYLRHKYKIEVVLDILRPRMRFDEVIKTYGYPMIGKRQANAISLARKNFEDGVYTLRLALLGMTVEEAKAMGLRLPSSELLDRYAKTTDKSKFNLPKYRKLLDVDFKVSDLCCDVMKKEPAHKYEKETGRKAILATMTDESALRENNWLQHGCNAFNSKKQQSAPMSFWTEQDVLQYIKREQDRYDREYRCKIAAIRHRGCHGGERRRIRKWLLNEYEHSTRLPIATVYGEIEYVNFPEQMRFEDFGIMCEGCEELHLTGCHRTGCVFCGFGCHLEESPSRFERLKITHPRQYEYCIGGGEYNEDGIWQPNKQGLGMGHVFEVLNQIYGEGFIKY